MKKVTKYDVEKKFNISPNASKKEVQSKASEIAKFCHKIGSIQSYVFYTMHVHKFKKAYKENEIISKIKEATGFEIWFCNGINDTTKEVTLGYEAYQGVISLMPEDDHEGFYNMPFDFEDAELVEKHDAAVFEVWKFLQTL
jgi:hypothetical protein